MTTLYEHGTLAMLMAANLDGTISLKDLLKHGSQGLGTFPGLDGEVIILDNEVFQAQANGNVNHITNINAKVPFASVHFPDDQESVNFPKIDFALLNNQFVQENKLENTFAAIRIDGTFDSVKVRVAPKQEKPYPGLLEVTEQQPVFDTKNIKGTLLGYYAPEIFGNVTATGWHVHFISDDRKFAGHVLEFQAFEVSGGFEIFDSLEQHFPIQNQDFREGKVDLDRLSAGIEKAEGSQD